MRRPVISNALPGTEAGRRAVAPELCKVGLSHRRHGAPWYIHRPQSYDYDMGVLYIHRRQGYDYATVAP